MFIGASILLLITYIKSSENGRILAIMPTPSYSHQIVFNPLWIALNKRGHHVTLLTTDPIKHTNLSNFRQVDWSFTYELWHEKHNFSNVIENFNTNFLKSLNQYGIMMNDIFTQELEHPDVQEILNNENEQFDLVIAEFLNPFMAAFSKRFNCPFIGVCPMDIVNFVHESLNNPISPALFPDFITSFDNDMNFIERTINTLYYIGSKMYFKYYFFPQTDEILRKYFGSDILKLEKLQAKASMVFLNINPITHYIRPLMSNVLMVGGGAHIEKNMSLPTDIQAFLDGADSGAIYFSLGTNVKSKHLPNVTKEIFLEVFSQLPYKVLWKFEDSTISTHANVMLKPWLPQQQILRHPNVKLFITQGGLQSLEEAIYSQLPIIAIPMYIDQFPNVKRVISKGMGITLKHDKIGKQSLKDAIIEVMKNPKYKSAAVRLCTLLKEQPISGLDQMVWSTEYVMRFKGGKFLKHPEIPLYQYLLLDVIAFLSLIGVIAGYCFYSTIKVVVYLIKQRRRDKSFKLE